MKKGLLLSIAASAMIFAGGDIAPVEPAAPASADFWGQIGFAYTASDTKFGDTELDFGDEQNNAFSATAVLGFEKQIGYGFGIGGEVAGWTDFGWDIADNPKVMTGDGTSAEVSQAYITYTNGNTAIKAGRQALPAAVSPWAWTDRNAGVADVTFDGIVIANTDLENTTLVGGWVKHVSVDSDIGASISDSGLFMLGAINKSLANTTVTVTGYYVPDNELAWTGVTLPDGTVVAVGDGTPQDMWSLWGTIESKIDGYNVGLQAAYVDGDIDGADATYAIAGKIGSTWNEFDAELVAGYVNDGDYSLRNAGSGLSTSAFWLDHNIPGDTFGEKYFAVLGKVGYKLNDTNTLRGSLGYWNFDDVNFEDAWTARAGWHFNTDKSVSGKVEYRYTNLDLVDAPTLENHQIRVEAYYKF